MTKWWQEAIVYQIYPRSFQDSNSDGIGDLNGIISRLDELAELGINAIWLSPIYASPNVDNGYDISDYKAIHPDFGTMYDMEQLIKLAADKGIKVIMDLVINHTSDQHEWFIKSKDPESEYRDYYYWKKNVNGKKPNNWTSFFGEDCWAYDASSDAYYLHLFAKEQPDLNYHNPKVLEEIKLIMKFWLDKGIAGFRCDVINIIFKNTLENGRRKLILTGREHYLSTEGMHSILQTLKKEILSDYDAFTVGETVFVTPQMGKALCDESRGELDTIFYFEHMETDRWFVKWFKRKFSPLRLFKVLTKWQQTLEWNAIYLENHDQPRSVSRFGDVEDYWEASSKLLATLLLTLKGTPFIYQGQEIGMTNFDFTDMSELRDVESFNIDRLGKKLHFPKSYRWYMMKHCSRDNARTPMQWSRERNAGFTDGTPWINLNKNHIKINYHEQTHSPHSVLSYYKKLIRLRKEHVALTFGEFELVSQQTSVYIYRRRHEKETLTVILNFSNKSQTISTLGPILTSNYDREYFDGLMMPYEAIILK